jgi:hypothetical protein
MEAGQVPICGVPRKLESILTGTLFIGTYGVQSSFWGGLLCSVELSWELRWLCYCPFPY